VAEADVPKALLVLGTARLDLEEVRQAVGGVVEAQEAATQLGGHLAVVP
jgi:hypothetical protein